MTATARPLSEWHEELGDVLWWKFPIQEAPWVGRPDVIGPTYRLIDWKGDEVARFDGQGWPGYHTHFTPLPAIPDEPPRPSFEDWLAQIDEEARRRGYGDGSHVEGTGADCWREFYDEGETPASALDADELNGL